MISNPSQGVVPGQQLFDNTPALFLDAGTRQLFGPDGATPLVDLNLTATGYVDFPLGLSAGGGFIDTSSGGFIDTSNGGFIATINGGYISTIDGGSIDTSSGGGYIATINGGYIATINGGHISTINGGYIDTSSGGYIDTSNGGAGIVTNGYLYTPFPGWIFAFDGLNMVPTDPETLSVGNVTDTHSDPAATDSGSPGQMIFTDTAEYRCFATGDWRKLMSVIAGVKTYSTY